MMATLKSKKSLNFLTRFLHQRSPGFNYSTTRTLETLAFEEVRSSSEKPYTSTAFVLHGLLESGRYWHSFSRNLASSLSNSSSSSEWRMVLVDLRNHGKSADIKGLDPPHDVFNNAKDLANLVKSHGWSWPDVVIGHSMGGKVALQFVQSCSRGDYGESAVWPKQLWALDSVPGDVKLETIDEVEKVLKTLQSLPSSFPSRKWLVNHMIELGFCKPTAEWISNYLKKSGEQEMWSFNPEGAIQMFDSYWESSYWSLLEHPPKGMEINILVAEKSDCWEPDVIQRLESLDSQKGSGSEGKVSLHVLPNSGHWLHVDNPKGLLQIVASKIVSLSALMHSYSSRDSS